MFESAIIEAARTNASPAAIWVICAVVVACLAFWLIAVAVAARPTPPARHQAVMRMTRSVVGGTHRAEGGRSVAPNRYAGVPAQRSGPGAAQVPHSAGSGQVDQRRQGRPVRSRGAEARR